MRKIISVVIGVLGSGFLCGAYASDSRAFNEGNTTVDLGLGTLSGQTKERVYDPSSGHKDSQLNWRFKNAAIIKGGVEWQVLPQISLGASGWATLGKRGGVMNDYDWEDENQSSWTSKSYHPSTELNRANQFDLNMKYWFLNDDGTRLGAMLGYQQTRYRFSAYGGDYNYNNGQYVGELPSDLLAITYRQTFKTPYLGLLANYRYQRWEVGGSLKYSAWGKASDLDEHYLTDTTFVSKIDKQTFYSLSLNAGYYLTENAKLYLEGVWSRNLNKKGWSRYDDRDVGIQDAAYNSAGIENYSLMGSVGLRYTF
nr:omptin family outer membrane protease [Rosenbergiella australiborealis]